MKSISVSFEFNGQNLKGTFKQPFGSGENVWHLYLDHFYQGQLVYSDYFGWKYYDQKKLKEMLGLSDFFGELVAKGLINPESLK